MTDSEPVDYGKLLRGDPRHGTARGYVHYDCRCSECRKAHNAATTARKRKRAGVNLPSYDERHGTNAGYHAGCRCADCTAAATAYVTARRAAMREAAKNTPTEAASCCETCGAVLAERLNGDLACARARCGDRGTVVGNSGADVGVLGGGW